MNGNPMMNESQGFHPPNSQQQMQHIPHPSSQTMPQINPQNSNPLGLGQQAPPGQLPRGMMQMPQAYRNFLAQMPQMYQKNFAMPQQQQKKQKKQTQKAPFPVVSKNQLGFIPPGIPQGMPQMADPQKIKTQLMSLNEEKADLFFRLFDIPPKKQKEVRIDTFLTFVNDLTTRFQNAPTYVLSLIEMFANQDLASMVRDPFLPVIFQREKNTKPQFYILFKVKNGIDYQVSIKEKKPNDMLIGSFMSIPMPQQPLSGNVQIDGKPVMPSQFGEMQESFVLLNTEQIQQKFRLHADLNSANGANLIFTFFVVQMVTRRNPIDIATQLCISKKAHFNPAAVGDIIPCVHPPSCQIDAATLFDSTFSANVAICPRCGKQLFLKEIEFDYRQDSTDSQDHLNDESAEKSQARTALSEYIANEIFPTNPKDIYQDDWLEELTPDSREIVFNSTDEYLESIKQFNM